MGRVIPVDQQNPSCEVLREATHCLASGGVLIIPTDSVYGIGCAAIKNSPAHERIFEIKKRPRTQTLPWLIADGAKLERYAAALTTEARVLAEAFWPGALTLVVQAAEDVPREYVAADGTLALRCPDSALVRKLARLAGPLATTSANEHGEPAATSSSGLSAELIEAADLVLDAGKAPLAIASTIVDVTGASPEILRVGAISEEAIHTALS